VALSVIFDHAQPRLRYDRLSAFADAPLFNPRSRDSKAELSGCTIEPVGGRVILEPYCLTKTWYTSNSGDYAKLALSAFASTSGWEERADQHARGPYLARPDATTGSLVTTTTYAKNQGFYIAFWSYGAGDVFISHQFGWNSTASTAAGISIEYASDSTVNVLQDGVAIGQGKISGSSTTNNTGGSLVELVVIPMARREIVIFSPSSGDGFSVIVPGIDESTSSPTILPASKFWLKIVAGASQIQVAPIKFPTSGTATSDRLSLLEPPASGETLEAYDNSPWPTGSVDYRVWGYPAYVGTQGLTATLRKWDGTAFSADGIEKNCRVRLTLTTDNQTVTPVAYGGAVAYRRTLTNTSDSEADVTLNVLDCTLSVAESPGDAAIDLVVRDPAGMAPPFVSTTTNRPIKVKIGSVTLFDGLCGDLPREFTANPAADTVQFEVRNRLKLLDEYVFTEPFPLDGFNFSSALSFLAARAFNSGEIDISTTSFAVPFEGSRSGGDWGSMVEVGDTALSWIERLIETYAFDWYWGVKPTSTGVKFFAKSLADLGTTPAVTVYETDAAAITGGVATADLVKFTVREVRETLLEPIANDVRVTGVDPRTGRPFQSHREDAASKNPTTAPGSRPDNWKGTILRYGLADPAITTQTLCNQVCTTIASRVFPARYAIEWKSDLLMGSGSVPLWRGDVVRIQGRGDYRIQTIGCQFDAEYGGSRPVFREALYTGEKL
jgi:hypothetical protein